MKNRLRKYLLLIVSIMFILMGFNSFKLFYNILKGNNASKNKNYMEAEKYYINAGKINSSNEVKNRILENLIRNRYNSGDYEFVVKNGEIEKFLKANSIVKISEIINNESKNKNLTESLKLYKEQLSIKDDLNVKKNYEIVKKMLENQENQNQGGQGSQGNQNNQGGQSSGTQGSTGEKDNKKQEIDYILKRLEGNEKQAFKNNEKINLEEKKESSNEW